MKTRLRRNKAKSYYAYIAENGLQEDDSEDIVGRAKRDLAFSDTRYGALGSALSRSGLFDGGYEEYLRSVNSENYADEMRRAKEVE